MEVENEKLVDTTSEESVGGAVTANNPVDIPQVTNEARAFAEKSAEMEKQQAELREQDQKLLEALDNVLERREKQNHSAVNQTREATKIRSFSGTAVNRGVGFLSLGLILVFMGIVTLICLFSQTPNFLLPLKLSPICAILVGIELLTHMVTTRGKIRVNIPCLIISALIVAGSCTMSVLLNKNYTKQEVLYDNRSIASEIYELSYVNLKDIADIETLKIDVDLNLDGMGKYNGTLSADDYVTVSVALAGVYNSPKLFAAECKKIIDGYKKMGINVSYYNFSNDSMFNSFRLNIEGKYAQDFSIDRLEERVNYIYIESNEFALTDLTDPDDEESD